MIKHAAKLFKELQTIPKEDVPIIVPVFNLVSYTKFMVEQLENYNINSFIICDNNSTYPPMIKYLEELSKTHRVVRFEDNLGPRVFTETKEFLSIMPDYFIVTDPDIKFNKNLPKNFISKMKRIIDTYDVSKAGFAIDIHNTRDKFFEKHNVDFWEGSYWEFPVQTYNEIDPIYIAPIDTTFCLHKKSRLIKELVEKKTGITNMSCVRIAGRFTCEHMGWWKEQPLTSEELLYYSKTQQWSATENYKRSM